MDVKERLNALEVALNNEMREREFYLKNARRTKNPLGKKMFQQIGDEELEHHERLKQLHEKWEKQEKWPETVPLKVKDTVVKDVLVEVLKKVDEMSVGDEDVVENADEKDLFEPKTESAAPAAQQPTESTTTAGESGPFSVVLSQIRSEKKKSDAAQIIAQF